MLDFSKLSNGLIPVIVQSVDTNEVLMQAFADRKAIELTFLTGFAHYFSRSRKGIWKKGETSGNTQSVVKVLVDCDNDCVIYIVNQKGNACHTGARSCFYRELKKEDI